MKYLALQDRINSLILNTNFSGVVSIKEKDKIIYENAAGFADKSNKIRNNIKTKFGIASGTKFFTALAIGKLIYKILSRDLTDLYVKPHVKAESEGENIYHGLGIWLRKEENNMQEYIVGCDAGVSFLSAVIRNDEIAFTVISNTTNGAWPIVREINRTYLPY